MKPWMLVFPIILGMWVFGFLYFRGKPKDLSPRDRAVSWLLFGGPFLVNLFYQRSLTKRELFGWLIVVLVVVAGIAFTQYTCLGLGRGEVCR